MTLSQLKVKVDEAIEHALARQENPDEIPVTLQIETEGDSWPSYAQEGLELHCDGGVDADGCVLVAWAARSLDLEVVS